MLRALMVGGMTALLTAACGGGTTGTTPPSSPPATTPPAAVDASSMVITQHEQEWVNAIVHKDTGIIEKLLADDFIGTTNDVRYGKSEALNDVKNGVHNSLDMEDVNVRLYGDTAVVTFDQNERSKHGEEDFSGHYMFTNVWVKRNGQWQAVSSHGSRVR